MACARSQLIQKSSGCRRCALRKRAVASWTAPPSRSALPSGSRVEGGSLSALSGEAKSLSCACTSFASVALAHPVPPLVGIGDPGRRQQLLPGRIALRPAPRHTRPSRPRPPPAPRRCLSHGCRPRLPRSQARHVNAIVLKRPRVFPIRVRHAPVVAVHDGAKANLLHPDSHFQVALHAPHFLPQRVGGGAGGYGSLRPPGRAQGLRPSSLLLQVSRLASAAPASTPTTVRCCADQIPAPPVNKAATRATAAAAHTNGLVPPAPLAKSLNRAWAAWPGSAGRPESAAGRRPSPGPCRSAPPAFFAIALRTMISSSAGTLRSSRRGGFGSSKAICRSSSWRSLPSKAGRSVSSSYSVAPSE